MPDNPKPLELDPAAQSATEDHPAFVTPPTGAPVYHGFPLVLETATGGWVYGAITSYQSESPMTQGDGFVVAPDGSRAGIVWATDTPGFYEILPTEARRWGVYGVRFPKPVSNLADLIENFHAVLPRLRERYGEVKARGWPEVFDHQPLPTMAEVRHSQEYQFGSECARIELAHGYPAYFYAAGNERTIGAVEQDTGLPIRFCGDRGFRFQWILGFNEAVLAHVAQRGLPWNARQRHLDILGDPAGYFHDHTSRATTLIDTQPFQPEGLDCTLTLHRQGNGGDAITILSKNIFIDPGTISRALDGDCSGPPQAAMPKSARSPQMGPGIADIPLRGISGSTIECVPGPPGSHLVICRFSGQRDEPQRVSMLTLRNFAALDTQLADWLPGSLWEPTTEWLPWFEVEENRAADLDREDRDCREDDEG